MTSHYHAVVWVDHREARVFTFNAAVAEKSVLHSHQLQPHLHRKSNSIGDGRAPADPAFFDDIARSLQDTQEILLTGPAGAKLELKKHLEKNWQQIARKVVGVESADHPTDGVLLDHARRYFLAADRMRPQRA